MATRAKTDEIEEEQDEVTRPSDLGFKTQPQHREIEVESMTPVSTEVDESGYVEIRMAETIEEFTYGNPHRFYRLEEGKRYRLPIDVARYLNGLGYIYHR